MNWTLGMPNLGHTMDEGRVQEWLKAVGDPVRVGEAVAIVESDKASFEVESPADGVLLAIHAEAGSVVLVGAAIGLVGRAEAASPPTRPPTPPTPRARVAPAARALALTLGIDAEALAGTGEGGLVTRDDVRAAAAAAKGTAAPVAAAPAVQPLSPMRRAIAEATQRAWQTIPAVPLHGHADIDALLAAGLPLTAAVARACALALKVHGSFNGWLRDGGFEPAATAALGVAVATPGGLVTAVLQQAESQSVSALNEQLTTLAEAARTGKLDGARTLGASFTLSSLGRWGVDAFVPLIAAPQVAILGVGAVRRAPRETDSGACRFVSELPLTLVFDHRANDGVAAAQLLAANVVRLQQPQAQELP